MLRRSYTAKPPLGSQINQGHPLAQGLVGCWMMNEGGGNLILDLTNRSKTSITTPLWKPSGLLVNSSTTYPSFVGSYSPGGLNLTVFLQFTPIGAPIVGSHCLWIGGNNVTAGFPYIRLQTDGLFHLLKSRQASIANANVGYTLNRRYTFTLTSDSGQNARGYCDGIKVFGPADLGGALSGGNPEIGYEGNSDGDVANGIFNFCYTYNRALRPEEIQWLYADPYAMFEQPRRGKWFFVAAGGETRNLPASIVGASVTPEISATNVRALLAGITGASLTSDITATTVRSLLANILSASTTPDVIALITRSLLATIVAESVTSSAVATIARSLLTNIQVVSSTPDITQTIIRNILANVSASSLTSDISAITARALAANIIGGSYTPDITVTMEGIINLIAAITGSSLTPDITATILRQLGSSISAQSITSDALVTIVRNLLASIFNTSVTPDNLICTFLGLSIRQQILDKIQTRFEGITASGSDSIRQKVMDAVDARLKTIS